MAVTLPIPHPTAKRTWAPGVTKVPREIVVRELQDTSRTVREVARLLGYSRKWLEHISSIYETKRPRGGDRRSPEARRRFEAACGRRVG